MPHYGNFSSHIGQEISFTSLLKNVILEQSCSLPSNAGHWLSTDSQTAWPLHGQSCRPITVNSRIAGCRGPMQRRGLGSVWDFGVGMSCSLFPCLSWRPCVIVLLTCLNMYQEGGKKTIYLGARQPSFLYLIYFPSSFVSLKLLQQSLSKKAAFHGAIVPFHRGNSNLQTFSQFQFTYIRFMSTTFVFRNQNRQTKWGGREQEALDVYITRYKGGSPHYPIYSVISL